MDPVIRAAIVLPQLEGGHGRTWVDAVHIHEDRPKHVPDDFIAFCQVDGPIVENLQDGLLERVVVPVELAQRIQRPKRIFAG